MAARGPPPPARAPLFLTEKPLLDFLFERALAVARREDMAMQLHTGYGDRDLDLPLSNPWLLRALLERSEIARTVPLVLLHGSFPYTGEAAVLAAIYPNVYFDVATCVPPFTEAIQMQVWRTALAMVPLSRIHASTDAAGLSEQIALGRPAGAPDARLCPGRAGRDRVAQHDRGGAGGRRHTGRNGAADLLRRVAVAHCAGGYPELASSSARRVSTRARCLR